MAEVPREARRAVPGPSGAHATGTARAQREKFVAHELSFCGRPPYVSPLIYTARRRSSSDDHRGAMRATESSQTHLRLPVRSARVRPRVRSSVALCGGSRLDRDLNHLKRVPVDGADREMVVLREQGIHDAPEQKLERTRIVGT